MPNDQLEAKGKEVETVRREIADIASKLEQLEPLIEMMELTNGQRKRIVSLLQKARGWLRTLAHQERLWVTSDEGRERAVVRVEAGDSLLEGERRGNQIRRAFNVRNI